MTTNHTGRHKSVFGRNWSSYITLALALVFAGGCSQQSAATHTSDPHLVSIDKMLTEQLPKGTTKARVTFYLNSRGYQPQDVRTNAVVAVVHHIDTETLQPATARVTFHFDSHDVLTSYDIEPLSEGSYQP